MKQLIDALFRGGSALYDRIGEALVGHYRDILLNVVKPSVTSFLRVFKHFSPRLSIKLEYPTTVRFRLTSDILPSNLIEISMTADFSSPLHPEYAIFRTAGIFQSSPVIYENNLFLSNLALLRELGKILIRSGVRIGKVRDILQYLYDLSRRMRLGLVMHPSLGYTHDVNNEETMLGYEIIEHPPLVEHLDVSFPIAVIVEVDNPLLASKLNISEMAREITANILGREGEAIPHLAILREGEGETLRSD